MSIKGGSIISVGNSILLDRLQTAGPGSLNIPRDKVYELGNYQSVGQVTDIPETTWTAESLDVSCEFECMLTRQNFSTITAGTVMKFTQSKPLDVISVFKAGAAAASPYDSVGAAAIPFLALESASYNFGVQSNASQTFTLRGDNVYYAPASMLMEETVGTNVANQSVALAELVAPYDDATVAGGIRYALSVCLAVSGKRLTYGSDYTEVVTGAGTNKTVSLTILAAVPLTEYVRVVYASPVVVSYPQISHAVASSTQPAAIRGRNIEVYINGVLITDRWTSVQSVQVDYKVTLDKDVEFSNPNVVSQDYDVPEVSGQLELKPRDYAELYSKICTITGVSAGKVVGALSSVTVPMTIKLKDPATGNVLKSLYIPDARFDLPGFSGRVQQKMTMTLPFKSDSGDLQVIAKQ